MLLVAGGKTKRTFRFRPEKNVARVVISNRGGIDSAVHPQKDRGESERLR